VNLPEARETGQRITALVQAEKPGEAYMLLAPILAGRTPFRLLDCIGQAIGAGPLPAVNAFLERIAADKTEGGWVVIASALTQQLDRDFAGAFSRCRDFVIAADIWYATDSLGERLPGPALRMDFQAALGLLSGWQTDPNPWVRRIIGVAVHFWAKRSGGKPQYRSQAESLLALLQPMFEERNLNALKGVGWGLKTLGKHYPDLVGSAACAMQAPSSIADAAQGADLSTATRFEK
jgi:hypothetical protein